MQTFEVFLEVTRGPHVRKSNNMTPKSFVLRPYASNLCDLQQVFVCV